LDFREQVFEDLYKNMLPHLFCRCKTKLKKWGSIFLYKSSKSLLTILPNYFLHVAQKIAIFGDLAHPYDFYTIFDNFFDQNSVLGHLLSFVFSKIHFQWKILNVVLFFFFLKMLKNTASAATFKFWGVYVLGHIFFAPFLGGSLL